MTSHSSESPANDFDLPELTGEKQDGANTLLHFAQSPLKTMFHSHTNDGSSSTSNNNSLNLPSSPARQGFWSPVPLEKRNPANSLFNSPVPLTVSQNPTTPFAQDGKLLRSPLPLSFESQGRFDMMLFPSNVASTLNTLKHEKPLPPPPISAPPPSVVKKPVFQKLVYEDEVDVSSPDGGGSNKKHTIILLGSAPKSKPPPSSSKKRESPFPNNSAARKDSTATPVQTRKTASTALNLELLSPEAGKGPPVSPLNNNPPAKAGRVKCNCKRIKCLKLYCDCFAAKQLCDPTLCSCENCCNREGEEEAQKNAIRETLQRNPNAFTPKVTPSVGNTLAHSKGCSCRRSGCMKKYCECFALGVHCGDSCTCAVCRNNPEGIEKVRPEREEGRKKKAKKGDDGSDEELGISDGEGKASHQQHSQESIQAFLINKGSGSMDWLDDGYPSSQNSQASQLTAGSLSSNNNR